MKKKEEYRDKERIKQKKSMDEATQFTWMNTHKLTLEMRADTLISLEE